MTTLAADTRPALLPTQSPLDLAGLSKHGFLPLNISRDYPALHSAFSSLFGAAQEFFALPDGSPAKTAFKAANGSQASEAGYSRIPGEKQILTLRYAGRTPTELELCERVRAAWNEAGSLVKQASGDIAESLGLPRDAYMPFVEPCVVFPDDKATPTLLRMFRYDRPEGQDAPPRVVAESHRDLGMLSLVIGHTPGLDVFEPPSAEHPEGRWISIEEESPEGGLTATLLSGQIMSLLTRGRYTPGVHRVSVRPATAGAPPFRFSLVFALRPAPAPVYTDLLQSPQTGEFTPDQRMDGESMASVFDAVSRRHFNININHNIRYKQKKELGWTETKDGSKEKRRRSGFLLSRVRSLFTRNRD